MTEHAWLTSTNLKALVQMAGTQLSFRKLMLFACAVVNWRPPAVLSLGWDVLRVVEQFADRRLALDETDHEVADRLRRRLEEAVRTGECTETERLLHRAALLGASTSAVDRGDLIALLEVSGWFAGTAFLGGQRLDSAQALFEQDLVARLRDIAGNPFRPAGIQPEWLAWNGGQVPRLARALYHERRFTEVPYLADALEDAGCADEVILRHLRGGGPHVRGCWVVDRALGLW